MQLFSDKEGSFAKAGAEMVGRCFSKVAAFAKAGGALVKRHPRKSAALGVTALSVLAFPLAPLPVLATTIGVYSGIALFGLFGQKRLPTVIAAAAVTIAVSALLSNNYERTIKHPYRDAMIEDMQWACPQKLGEGHVIPGQYAWTFTKEERELREGEGEAVSRLTLSGESSFQGLSNFDLALTEWDENASVILIRKGDRCIPVKTIIDGNKKNARLVKDAPAP